MKLNYVIFDREEKNFNEKQFSLGERFDFIGLKRVIADRNKNSLFVQHEDDPTFYPIKFFLSYCAALSFVEDNAVTRKFETIVIG